MDGYHEGHRGSLNSRIPVNAFQYGIDWKQGMNTFLVDLIIIKKSRAGTDQSVIVQGQNDRYGILLRNKENGG